MKYFSACVLIALMAFMAGANADFRDDMKALGKTCQQEVQVSQEDLQKFFKNGMKPADASEGVKCHFKCMMEKRGHFKDGQFDDKAFIESSKNIPFLKDRQAEIAKVAATCKNEKGATPCETAFKIAMCFKENKEALGITKPQ